MFPNKFYNCAEFEKNLRGSVENSASLDMEWPIYIIYVYIITN